MREGSLEALLRARYGASHTPTVAFDPPEALKLLLRHRSVRAFTDEPVTEDQLTAIIAAAQSAPSSSNHQAYSIIEVRDADRKKRLHEQGRGSSFVPDAPVILLFVADWARHGQLAQRAGEPSVAHEYLESTLVGAIDAALVAQNAAIAASALGLGTCFLGSLRNEPDVMVEEFSLPTGTVILFGLALGWPDPSERAGIKPRLPQRAVWHREHYRDSTPDAVETYERTLAAYYADYGRSHSWIRTAIGRIRDVAGLHGRERMRAAFTRQGLHSR